MLDALIVGAGPTGLSLAIGLMRQGLSCRTIDRAAGPATTSRASDCHARTMEILEDLGIASDVAQRATIVDVIRVYHKDAPFTQIPWEPPDSPYPWNYVLPQTELEALLRHRLGQLGGRVEWGTAFANLRQHGDHITGILADGTTIHSKWLVGCDGAHSGVRRALGIPFQGAAYPQLYYLGDVQPAGEIPRRIAHLWLDPRGVTLLMPLGQSPYWRIFTDVSCLRDGDGTLPPLSLTFFQQLMLRRQPHDARFRVAQLAWSSTFMLDRRHAEAYRLDRAFLAGDAAHVFSPFGGQGMNTGIQDAYNLAWKLAAVEHGYLQAQVLDTYHLERSPIAAEISARVHSNTRFLCLRNNLICFVRNVSMRALLSSRRFCRAIVNRTTQLTLSYHGLSGLVAHHDACRRPRAGDRAPDAPLPKTMGSHKRLFASLQGDHVLLLFSASPTCSTEQQDLEQACLCVRQYIGPHLCSLAVDPTTAPILCQRYNVRRATVILIRPDGYIGYRGPARNHRALQRYMSRNYRLSTSSDNPWSEIPTV